MPWHFPYLLYMLHTALLRTAIFNFSILLLFACITHNYNMSLGVPLVIEQYFTMLPHGQKLGNTDLIPLTRDINYK
jgi:hypothetical protein